MEKVIVVYSSNRPIEREFYCTLLALAKMGAHVIEQFGSPDLGLARNAALTLVTNELVAQPDKFDTVLMLDDDMVVSTDVVEALVAHSRVTGYPTSACYVLADGRIAAEPAGNCFLTGLGCIAIPAALLLKVARSVPSAKIIAGSGVMVRTFTFSGPDEDDGTNWIGDDYRLCDRLGGVDLLPLPAGHIKKRLLLPTTEAMHAITNKKKEKT